MGWENVISVEPSPRNWAVLQKKTSGAEKISIFRRAVLDRSETKKEFYMKKHRGSDSFTPGGEVIGKTTVKCVTLDGLFDLAGVKKAGLIKIDVEGSEFKVLDGGRDSLEKTKKLIVEAHTSVNSKKFRRIIRLLVKKSFSVRIIKIKYGRNYILAEK